jgi:hypothetical protein
VRYGVTRSLYQRSSAQRIRSSTGARLSKVLHDDQRHAVELDAPEQRVQGLQAARRRPDADDEKLPGAGAGIIPDDNFQEA